MKLYVGVTDKAWYETLKALPGLDEVNFWKPGGRHRFGAVAQGELFLFKLHHTENAIVGGGVFAHSTILPTSLAWEAFGVGNGAQSFQEMRVRVEKYRRERVAPHEDYPVGCVLLQQPFFFEESNWIPAPSDFQRNIVQGKTYALDSVSGRRLFEEVEKRMPYGHPRAVVGGPMFGGPILVQPRLGQGTFRVLITDAYERRCAVTEERVLPVLEAAHIKPVSLGGQHRVDNGILLRSDFHTLYDRGYITIGADHKIRVSRRLKDDFSNGREYYRFANQKLRTPRQNHYCPSREALEWHADTMFLG